MTEVTLTERIRAAFQAEGYKECPPPTDIPPTAIAWVYGFWLDPDTAIIRLWHTDHDPVALLQPPAAALTRAGLVVAAPEDGPGWVVSLGEV